MNGIIITEEKTIYGGNDGRAIRCVVCGEYASHVVERTKFPLCSACTQDLLQCNQKIVSLAEYAGETNPVSTTLNNNAIHTQRVITLKMIDARYDDVELMKEGGNVFTQVYLNLTLLPFTDKHRAALRNIGEIVNEEDVDRNTYESTFDKVSTLCDQYMIQNGFLPIYNGDYDLTLFYNNGEV